MCRQTLTFQQTLGGRRRRLQVRSWQAAADLLSADEFEASCLSPLSTRMSSRPTTCLSGRQLCCWLATLQAISDPYCHAASVAVSVCLSVRSTALASGQRPRYASKLAASRATSPTGLLSRSPTRGVTLQVRSRSRPVHCKTRVDSRPCIPTRSC